MYVPQEEDRDVQPQIFYYDSPMGGTMVPAKALVLTQISADFSQAKSRSIVKIIGERLQTHAICGSDSFVTAVCIHKHSGWIFNPGAVENPQ